MKKLFFLALLSICLATPTFAQQKQAKQNHRPDITNMISDLSNRQKKQLDKISSESNERMKSYRLELRVVRDSIHYYMSLDGDQSAKLFPLFERESTIQVKISKELYSSRVKIDEVLTPDQRKELKAKMKSRHHATGKPAHKPTPKPVNPKASANPTTTKAQAPKSGSSTPQNASVSTPKIRTQISATNLSLVLPSGDTKSHLSWLLKKN